MLLRSPLCSPLIVLHRAWNAPSLAGRGRVEGARASSGRAAARQRASEWWAAVALATIRERHLRYVLEFNWRLSGERERERRPLP